MIILLNRPISAVIRISPNDLETTIELIQQIKAKNPNINPTDLNTKVEEQVASQKAKAETILAQVKQNPDDFAKFAEKYSDDKASAERGGELGFFTKEAMVPEFSKAAFSMRPNTISDKPVKTQYGYHIIMVTDRAAASVTPFEKAKPDIKGYLENQKQLEMLDNLTESLKKNAKIEYVNPEYSPEVNQKAIQENIKNTAEAAKKAKEQTKK